VTITMCEPVLNRMTMTVEHEEMAELASSQLLRGEDARLVERLQPLVQNQNIALDMACVDRIDAAGISALLELYQIARVAGHHFTVTNLQVRVAEVLNIVGLDGFLVSHNAAPDSHYGSHADRTAA
jgi:anti-anti-sigma factor